MPQYEYRERLRGGLSTIRLSKEYETAISAAYDFGNHRLEERVRENITLARLFRYALRSLDVYGPTRELVEKALAQELSKSDRQQLENALKGLDFLLDSRYHPSYQDHRIFPSLRQYHEALTLVEQSLGSGKDAHAGLETVYSNFCAALEAVTSGSGLYVVNWKTIPRQTSTLYAKVNLEISRLVAGELVGVYVVKVESKGRVPHHLHRYLWEHHFLPEPIEGVHQVGKNSATCTQSDIVYIRPRQIHAFRNDENTDRSFLFVCGSQRTGPWDFVQDITTFPELDFPKNPSIDVGKIGGRKLHDLLHILLERRYSKNIRKQLTPDGSRLSHHSILVTDTYSSPNKESDIEYYVANGSGTLQINNSSTSIRIGDTFVVPVDMRAEIANDKELILYEFSLTL